jgi:hypothetical protein
MAQVERESLERAEATGLPIDRWRVEAATAELADQPALPLF